MNTYKDKYYNLFSIGYSGFSITEFVEVLHENQINAVADVRSVPFSKFKPEFNRDTLKSYLKEQQIQYVFLGDYCGARIDEPECYSNGKVDFNLVAKHPRFLKGIDRIEKGLKKYAIALMCAEKDPIKCHRMILVCRELRKKPFDIYHIISAKNVQSNNDAENRLMKAYNYDQSELFRDEGQQLIDAYNKQADKIAYVEKNEANTEAVQEE